MARGVSPDLRVAYCRDVARIELGSQDYSVAGRYNGKPSAVIATYQLPGSNAVDAANGVKKLMAQMKERFPEDLDFVIALDTTRSVTEGMKEIVITLLIALGLVVRSRIRPARIFTAEGEHVFRQVNSGDLARWVAAA